MPDIADEELMLMLKYGNRDAFDVLFEKYRSPVLNFIWRMMGDLHAAEDLLVEVFTTLFDRRRDYSVQGRFSSWLFTIARNITLNEIHSAGYRKWGRLVQLPETFEAQASGPRASSAEKELFNDETRDLLARLLGKLPPKYREAVVLHDVEDLSSEEIGGILGVPAATVRTRLQRARKMLRRAYEGERNAVRQG